MNHVNMFCFIDCYGILWYPPIRSNPISTFLFLSFFSLFRFQGLFRGAGPKRKKSLKEKALDLVFENHNNNDCGEGAYELLR